MNVSLEVERGEIVTLIRANGAGKTTLHDDPVAAIHAPPPGAFRYEGEERTGLTRRDHCAKG